MSQLRWDSDKFHLGLKRHVFFNRDAPLSGDSGALRQSQSSSRLNLGNTNIPSSDVASSSSLTQLPSSDTLNVFENIGPFEHHEFKNPSDFEPKQNPRSLETFIDMNEMELSKVIFGKNRPENITLGERQGLQDLARNDKIDIEKADKGSSIVIMDREDYVKEGLSQLENPKFYCEKSENQTEHHNKIICDSLQDMFKCGEITKKTLEYLRQACPRTPEFYMLP